MGFAPPHDLLIGYEDGEVVAYQADARTGRTRVRNTEPTHDKGGRLAGKPSKGTGRSGAGAHPGVSFRNSNSAGRILSNGLGDAHDLRHEMRPVVRRRASDDPVVIVRKPLRFFQPLLPARRTAIPVGVSQRSRIERLNDRLRPNGRLMNRPIPEIDLLFWMTRGSTGIGGTALVPRIRAGDRVATCQDGTHGEVTNVPGESAVPHGHELAVPGRDRQPHFGLDLGVAAAQRLTSSSLPRFRWCSGETVLYLFSP